MTSLADNPIARRIVPPIAAVLAIGLFVSLGLWQLDRAAEKEGMQALFDDDAPYSDVSSIDTPVPFQRIETRGRLLTDRQVLIDNIVQNGRLGYYVITPLEYSRNEPLLLVNRGFVERGALESGAVSLDADDERNLIRGRAGNLPRVGIRGGAAFESSGEDWPRIAVYPTADEVAAELDRDVLAWALLLSPEDERGFARNWQPSESGPMTHYGYAFQWFAMATAVLVIAGWHLNKRRKRS